MDNSGENAKLVTKLLEMVLIIIVSLDNRFLLLAAGSGKYY